MKFDELAFFNQQLAGMLKSGLPLEGSLEQLSKGMAKGTFREEMEQLQADLKNGVPLASALEKRKVPEFYKRVVIAGARAQSLPQVLLLLADYYREAGLLWTRVRASLVYPGIVLVISCILSILIWSFYGVLQSTFRGPDLEFLVGFDSSSAFGAYFPMLVIIFLTIVYLVVTLVRPLRQWLMWRMPGLHEASLSRFSHLFGTMLSSGCPLKETLPVLGEMERKSPAEQEIQTWEKNIESGQAAFHRLAPKRPGRFPELFYWLVGVDREDWGGGLLKAAEIYRNRAANKLELVLSAGMPVCVILLGLLILFQAYSFYISLFGRFMDSLYYW